MAKSPTETIRELQNDVTRLVQRLDSLVDTVNRADLLAMRECLAVIENQIAELRKREEEADRRRWQTQLLFFGSLLTLAIQLTVLFLKK